MSMWLVWLVLALVAAGIAAAVSSRYRPGTARLAVVAVIAAASTVAVLSLYRDAARAQFARVSIDSPRTGAVVRGYRLLVNGTVQPSDAVVTVLVRSETDLRWWVQPVVRGSATTDARSGHWVVDAYVGTAEAGAGENFQLMAVASADGTLFNLLTGRHLSQGQRLETLPLWATSRPVVVHRVE